MAAEDEKHATRYMQNLAKRPSIEKAAKALSINDRGHDDDYWLYDLDVEIALRESGAVHLLERAYSVLSSNPSFQGLSNDIEQFLTEYYDQ